MRTLFTSSTIAVIIAILILPAGNVLAQGEGEHTLYNFMHGDCQVERADIAWRFNLLLGEPVIMVGLRWEAAPGTSERCVSSFNTKVYLQVSGNNGGSAYVGYVPSIERAGGDFGFDVSSAPQWNRLFCGTGSNSKDCFDREMARTFWSNGFYVSDVIVENTRY